MCGRNIDKEREREQERETESRTERERERETWDIAKRDIERGSEGDRSRERSTPAAVHFPSAEKLSVDTSRRFPFTLPFRNAEGEGVCFVFDCGFMLVRFSVHSQLGVFTPVRMKYVREGRRARKNGGRETERGAQAKESGQRETEERRRRERDRERTRERERNRKGERASRERERERATETERKSCSRTCQS